MPAVAERKSQKKRAVCTKPPAQAFVMPHTPVKRHRAPQHFCAAADSSDGSIKDALPG
jgi:hypothetical protein